MLERFRRDQTGVAMGLAVMMIVLIGVMGAGLLVFVRNDLQAVVEVNQGQRAMDIADAGVQAAKAQLLADNIPAHYDVDDTLSQVFNDLACNIHGTDLTNPRIRGETIGRNPSSENWSPEDGGQTRTFAGGQFNVTIRWMTPLLTAPPDCQAPRTSLTGILPGGTEYFKVVSTGTYGNATRKVEVIYETYDLRVPKAYYTPGPITVGGDACIDSVSLFTLSDVTFNGNGGCRDALGVKMNSHMKGTDLAYGDWKNPPLNTTARPPVGLLPMTDAGVGAAGRIEYKSGATSKLGSRDFDSTTTPKFVQTPSNPQPTSEITFPFDVGSQPDANRLCDQAKAQETKPQERYITDDSTGIASLNTWPDNSSYNTVVCYNFTNPTSTTELKWAVPGDIEIATGSYKGCKDSVPRKRGTLVVRGGGFTIKPNTALFEGIVVVRGPADQESEISNTDETGLSGNTCLDGFVNSTGPISITGTVTPSGSAEVNNRPGFYGVRTWAWRELYE